MPDLTILLPAEGWTIFTTSEEAILLTEALTWGLWITLTTAADDVTCVICVLGSAGLLILVFEALMDGILLVFVEVLLALMVCTCTLGVTGTLTCRVVVTAVEADGDIFTVPGVPLTVGRSAVFTGTDGDFKAPVSFATLICGLAVAGDLVTLTGDVVPAFIRCAVGRVRD